MIDAAVIFAAETDVERGDSVVLEKRGVIRAGAERGNAQIGALANFFALLGCFGVGNFSKLLALPGT
jgi:hypothetical protein